MRSAAIRTIRNTLGLAQPEFGQLFGVHPMTVSRWERDELVPSPYQQALMSEFGKAAGKEDEVSEKLKALLFAAGVVAAIYFLLNLAKK